MFSLQNTQFRISNYFHAQTFIYEKVSVFIVEHLILKKEVVSLQTTEFSNSRAFMVKPLIIKK